MLCNQKVTQFPYFSELIRQISKPYRMHFWNQYQISRRLVCNMSCFKKVNFFRFQQDARTQMAHAHLCVWSPRWRLAFFHQIRPFNKNWRGPAVIWQKWPYYFHPKSLNNWFLTPQWVINAFFKHPSFIHANVSCFISDNNKERWRQLSIIDERIQISSKQLEI